MTLCARLDKTGTWVICGLRDCGERIAKIALIPDYAEAKLLNTPDGMVVTPPKGGRMRVVFGPEWARDHSGVWRQTKRAGKVARLKELGYDLPDGLTRRLHPRPLDQHPVEAAHGVAANVEAACPSCGSRQLIDIESLQAQVTNMHGPSN